MANDSDNNSDGGKPSEPKGTKYGFARIDGKGEQVDSSKAQLPTPLSKKQDAPAEAAPAEAPVLRRVEHEMAEPARLTASTHTGREIRREQVEEGLAQQVSDGEPNDDLPQIDGLALRPVKSEDLIKHDLLEAKRPSPLQRGLQLVAWTRLRLIGALVGAALVVIAVVIVIVLRCGGSTDKAPTPVVSGHLPGEKDKDQVDSDPAEPAPDTPRADPDKAAAPPSPSDYVVQVAAARRLVEQNFCQDAAEMLLPVLRNKKPDKQNAEGYYLLGRSLVCGGKEREGLVAYERALIADEARYRQDKALVADLGFLLTRDNLQESTIQLVAKRIGAPAVEVMLAASSHNLQRVRAHAVAALERIGASEKIDWQTTLWLDLQQLPCDKRPAVIEKIVEKLPGRSAKLLRAAVRSPKQQCVREQLKQQLAKIKPARKNSAKKKEGLKKK